MTRIKVCGLVREVDVDACVALGVDRLGLNLVPVSPRAVDVAHAARLVEVARRASSSVEIVLVLADREPDDVRRLLDETGADLAQLHGREPPDAVRSLLPRAMKAVRIAGPGDVAVARGCPGDEILVDAKVEGVLGGSGAVFDWSLVVPLARDRRLSLAGGLTEHNVERAVAAVRPAFVDVASGVEDAGAPRAKSLARLRAFVSAVRRSTASAR